MLSPLSKSEYTVHTTQYFINFIKAKKIPSNHQLIPFDVVLLFLNVPIDATIDIIKHLWKKIDTRITKNELKEIMLLCTKGVPLHLVVKFISK